MGTWLACCHQTLPPLTAQRLTAESHKYQLVTAQKKSNSNEGRSLNLYNGAEKNLSLNKKTNKKSPSQQPGLSPLHKKKAAFRQLSSAGRTDSHAATLAFHPVTPLIMELV